MKVADFDAVLMSDFPGAADRYRFRQQTMGHIDSARAQTRYPKSGLEAPFRFLCPSTSTRGNAAADHKSDRKIFRHRHRQPPRHPANRSPSYAVSSLELE